MERRDFLQLRVAALELPVPRSAVSCGKIEREEKLN
jgi:hypothetical protein